MVGCGNEFVRDSRSPARLVVNSVEWHDQNTVLADVITLTRRPLPVRGEFTTTEYVTVAVSPTATLPVHVRFGALYVTPPQEWAPMFAYVDHAHAAGGDVEYRGRRYGLFLHDWRVTPQDEWLELMEPLEA